MLGLLGSAVRTGGGPARLLSPFVRHARGITWQAPFQTAAATAAPRPRLEGSVRRPGAHWRGLATQAKGKADAADADAVGDLGDDDFEEGWEEFEEDVGPEVSTGNLDWGEAALTAARELLAGGEEFQDIELFSLRAITSGKRLDIRLDKMTDLYGSPSLDDIEAFSRAFNARLEAALGEAAAGEIEIEVSSPGAERAVRFPGELERFEELPMKVEFHSGEGGEKVDTRVLQLEGWDQEAAVTRWKLANVRVNRQGAQGKGRGGLTKKQREQIFEIPVAALRRVNLHLDL